MVWAIRLERLAESIIRSERVSPLFLVCVELHRFPFLIADLDALLAVEDVARMLVEAEATTAAM